MSTPQAMPYRVVAFYKYAAIPEAEDFCTRHLRFCLKLGIAGRIYIANEGINGQLSGTAAQIEEYIAELDNYSFLEGIQYKIDEAAQPAFNKCHVRYKNEIVHSNLPVDPTKQTGKYVDGATLQRMMQDEDVVLVDMRSEYEHRVGRFKGAVTLPIDNFRELPEHIDSLKKYRHKKVVTYCTGGIKCEKASAYLLSQGFEDVYQLHGGVIQYAKETGGKDFEGDLYVFDGRVTVPVNSVNPTHVSHCIHCRTGSSRMINCANEECNKKIVVCEECGWEWDGTCSAECKSAEHRAYTGTGFYAKPATGHRRLQEIEKKMLQ